MQATRIIEKISLGLGRIAQFLIILPHFFANFQVRTPSVKSNNHINGNKSTLCEKIFFQRFIVQYTKFRQIPQTKFFLSQISFHPPRILPAKLRKTE